MSKPCQSRGRQRRGQFQSRKRRRTSGTGLVILSPDREERGLSFADLVAKLLPRKKEA